MSDEVYKGEVIFFSIERGYGFISWVKDGVLQNDMFCYWSDIDMPGFKRLQADQKVSFKIGENNEGKPKAVDIKVLDPE